MSCPLTMLLPLFLPLSLLDLIAVCHDSAFVQEARKDRRQGKPSSEAAAARPSQGLHSMALAPSSGNAAQADSAGGFPGFAVLPAQQVAAAAPTGTAKPGLRKMTPHPSCSTESCLLQPVLSQEPKLPRYSLASEAHPQFIVTSSYPMAQWVACTCSFAPHACSLLALRLPSEFL